MTSFTPSAPAAASSIFAERVARWVIGLVDQAADRRARRATLHALEQLDAHTLADIGVTRADIEALR
ncbi:MAG: DUF1127 domain-containing protein [Caldilineaceae bacterium]|nr:DUF1127 domain-containing protein [Caldilineaceae bacterium]MCB1347729.1 DUF1127 domain-containing protein [Maritimibacter sp.]